MTDIVEQLHVTAARLDEWVQKYVCKESKSREAKLMREAASRIKALEARIAKADALAEVLSRLRGREGPLTSWLDVQEALAAYREGSDT